MKLEEKTRIVKRYSNRKLYDTRESRYVTLDEVGSMVKNGEEIQIIDNRTGKDLTEVTLAQILFEEQKKQNTRMPLGMLQEIIRTRGAAFTQLFQRHAAQPVQAIKEEVERKVDHIIRKSETTAEDAARQVREYISIAQRSLDDLLAKLDGRIHSMVETASSPGFFREQLNALKKRIEELESRIRDH